jgi:hypothetical protein
MSSKSPEPGAEPATTERAFRSPAGMVGGVLVLALVLWLVIDAIVRGDGLTPWFAVAGLLLVAPLVAAYTLRPAVFADEDRIRIRNPLRTITVPWAAVGRIQASYSTELTTGDGTKYQLWAIPVSLGQRKRANRRRDRLERDRVAGRTPDAAVLDDPMARGDRTVEELRELAERGSARPGAQGPAVARWAYEVLAPTAAGAVLLVVLLAVR